MPVVESTVNLFVLTDRFPTEFNEPAEIKPEDVIVVAFSPANVLTPVTFNVPPTIALPLAELILELPTITFPLAVNEPVKIEVPVTAKVDENEVAPDTVPPAILNLRVLRSFNAKTVEVLVTSYSVARSPILFETVLVINLQSLKLFVAKTCGIGI